LLDLGARRIEGRINRVATETVQTNARVVRNVKRREGHGLVVQNRKQEVTRELARHFAFDVSVGLRGKRKSLPFRYLYDSAGSKLFEQICLQPEYYPTRTEASILAKFSPMIAQLLNNRAISVIELGSGKSTKTKILLEQFKAMAKEVVYFPIDISDAILHETAVSLTTELGINVIAIPAEYSKGIKKANKIISKSRIFPRKLILFLGSSIGNFEPREAAAFLRMIRETMKEGDVLLIGFDLHKDRRMLDAAYNDKNGITARFNLNLLERINMELQGQFDVDKFAHIAFYNEKLRRIEMHLVSKEDQNIYIAYLDKFFHFERGETIHTENSYKYDMHQIKDIAKGSGLILKDRFMDEKKWFCLALFIQDDCYQKR